ncbi:hypothetical protein PoB_007285400 [Plakobranchus ocellatus]|uniref:Uncharacterized protein n=1 Tax=Plakobranchus ocellatus TaxID=259542 RepID=A0AAV4DQR6_9GAST|nr:hypothetical protein PoB_007285400 [Plakobranchus ocellatus]
MGQRWATLGNTGQHWASITQRRLGVTGVECYNDNAKPRSPFTSLQPTTIPQQGDLRLSGPLSDQGAGGRARTRDRRVPADLRADSLVTVPPYAPKRTLSPNNSLEF